MREKKSKMRSKWLKNPLGEEMYQNGYASVEIDESKIIGNSQKILWMLGIVERVTNKNKSIYCYEK